jgi:hypothetical protein
MQKIEFSKNQVCNAILIHFGHNFKNYKKLLNISLVLFN